MNFTLTQEEYESLIALSRAGAQASGDPNKSRQLETWLRLIEKRNGVTRDLVVVIWQELNAPLPTGTFFPTTWPPNLKRTVELTTRRVSRSDIDKVLEVHASNPISVLCTHDPEGVLGLIPIDDFFIQ
jgi:hypothetical protein